MSEAQNQKPTEDAAVSYDLTRIWVDGAALDRQSNEESSKQIVHEAWRGIRTSPLTSIITVVTMAISLFVFAGFLLLLANVGDMFASVNSETTLSIFLRDGVSSDAKTEIETALEQMPEVDGLAYRSKDDALKSFRESLGAQAFILEGLERENPLPASYEIKFKKDLVSGDLYERISNRFSSNNAVEHVHYNQGLVGNLAELLRTFRVLGIAAVILMLIVTAFIIGNTIQLSLYARREEIEIMRLVGATDSFIRAPYILEGVIQGICGCILALIVSWFAYVTAINVINRSAALSLIFQDLHFLNTTSIFLVLTLGLLVGFVGSALAVRRFLNA